MKTANRAVRIHRGPAALASWQDWIVDPKAAKEPPAKAQPEPAHPSQEAIARLAYALWEERGRPFGSPEQDWLRAEQSLLSRQEFKQ